ncbi:hypothetical protein [Nakamurella deserti]|uniref:hypothetical protein n=1 Tax=Nakamurella deserti TaxID=2164074 RepID=UPI000DBE0516|nr:hypothetical protein [Nakamurella deserti]
MKIPAYLELVDAAEDSLAGSFRRAAEVHPEEPDIVGVCTSLAGQCEEHRGALGPLLRRYGAVDPGDVPDGPPGPRSDTHRTGSVGLLCDLQDLWMLASFVHLSWTVVEQAANGLRDHGLATVVRTCDRETEVQLQWLTARIKQTAPHALIAGR